MNLPLPEVEEIELSRPINQYHAKLLNDVSENAVSYRNWESQSRSGNVSQLKMHEWPKRTTR